MEVDHLKFRLDLVEGLLVKYSVQCEVSNHHVGDNTMKRLTERFPTRVSPQKRNINQQDCVWSSASMTEEEILYIVVRGTVMLLCVLMGFPGPTQGTMIEVM
jgi:hypothetical protein